ncbi:hypothetical protein MITS9509_00693 [Synechococcus sp. MIT S9509]|nr:hypothetical protein MITS9504_00316 [Synechococcus sp. MIT S9504]KZR93398.1 hypothetical protein MITS9509_00693 [Synechococcus sp. MIT S9509]
MIDGQSNTQAVNLSSMSIQKMAQQLYQLVYLISIQQYPSVKSLLWVIDWKHLWLTG